jgi:hypothetical protein
MNKLLISAGTAAVLALAATPATAATSQTQVSANANAQAKIYRPLSIANNQGLDFGTLVLSGTGTYSTPVAVGQAGALTYDTTYVTPSGTTQAATFTVKGTSNQTVNITLPQTSVSLTGSNGGTLSLTLDAPATAALGSAGPTTGATFGVGGSLTLTNLTTDGVYTGTFAVNADYQ